MVWSFLKRTKTLLYFQYLLGLLSRIPFVSILTSQPGRRQDLFVLRTSIKPLDSKQ